MISQQKIHIVFSSWRHVTPTIPFVYKIFSLLVVPLNIIGIVFAGSLIKHNHSLPLIIFLATFMLRSTHFIVNSYANLCIFVVPLILSNATIEMLPTLITPACYISIVNLHDKNYSVLFIKPFITLSIASIDLRYSKCDLIIYIFIIKESRNALAYSLGVLLPFQ